MTHKPTVDGVDCTGVQERLAGGAPLGAAARAHVAACPICSMPAAAPAPGSDALLASIEAAVAGEQGLGARLRELPTPHRMGLAAASALLLGAAVAAHAPRWGYGPVPVTRLVLVVAVLATLLSVTIRLGMRPLQDAPPRRAVVLAGLASGLAAPLLFALFPSPIPASVAPLVGSGAAMASCFALGLLPGAAVVLVLRVLDRQNHGSARAALLAAVAGGLAGNIGLELHCPIAAPAHLLLGHATVGFALAIAYLRVSRIRRG